MAHGIITGVTASPPTSQPEPDPLAEAAAAFRRARDELAPIRRAYKAASAKERAARRQLIAEMAKASQSGGTIRELYFRMGNVWTQENIRKQLKRPDSGTTA